MKQKINERKNAGLTLNFIWSVLKNNFFLCLVFFSVVFTYGYFYASDLQKSKVQYFQVKKIDFDGNDRVPDILLRKASGLRYKSNIFSCDIKKAKERLERVSWIRSAMVQRILPDKIYVRVSERVPIAILQCKHKLHLIDTDGKILDYDGIGNFENLPIIVGEKSEKETSYLLNCLEKFPKIRKQLVFAVWVGKRRWNIKLNRGIMVKLPEKNLDKALTILDEISDDNGFFNSDIAELDMRLLDRVVINKNDKKKEE